MKIQFKQIKDIVDAIFSENGYNIQNLNIHFPEPLNINVVRTGPTDISLTFTESLPKVTWKKFITLSARIVGISLGQAGGVLKLKYLPDIKFSYDSQSEQLFGQTYDFSDIEQQIYSEFQDDESRIVAKKCLRYASEWATIASQGCSFKEVSSREQRKLKNDCKKFVVENIKNDQELRAGSVIITFLFFYIVLPVILKFILEKLFNKLFN